MTKYDEEIELAPGIYLTKMSKKADPVALEKADETKEAERTHMEFLEQHPKEHFEWIKAQIFRIGNSLEKLEYSNKEMLAVDPTDVDFVEAVNENIVIMERQRKVMDTYKKQAQELAQKLGLCFQDYVAVNVAERGSAADQSEEMEEGGVYL
jgi:hypothetical protein